MVVVCTLLYCVHNPVLLLVLIVLQWVYNILDKKCEKERIIFEDPDMKTGFVLLPDMKWDGKQLEDLYVVALVQDRTLHSIRSLTAEHIPLLDNIHKKGLVCIVAASHIWAPEL